MNIGDRVTTPHGPATIIDIRANDEHTDRGWQRRALVIVRYPNGRNHAWVPAKIKAHAG